MSWHEGTLVAFDLETTGIDVETARIVTASVVVINPSTGAVDTTEWLANPGVDIPAGATAVHGITTEMARESGQDPDDVCAELDDLLHNAGWDQGNAVIAYNAAYDLSVLDRELARHWPAAGRFADDHGPVIDPFVIDKHCDRYRRGSRKLIDTAKHYGVEFDAGDAHGAAADALAAARIAWKLAKVYPEIGKMPLAELHANQVEWHAEQAAGLQAYWAKQGKTEQVPTEWPVRLVTA